MVRTRALASLARRAACCGCSFGRLHDVLTGHNKFLYIRIVVVDWTEPKRRKFLTRIADL